MTARIRTRRLDLIPATREILESERDDRRVLGQLLAARVPGAWPPPLLDEGAIRELLRMITDPEDPHFAMWYWVLGDPASCAGEGDRVLVGSGGILPAENGPDTVIIGYSVLDAFQGRGYATEAVGAIVPEVFSHPGVGRIVATTYPELGASVRVLEKNGFVRAGLAMAGTGAGEGSICFVRERDREQKRSGISPRESAPARNQNQNTNSIIKK